MDPPSLKELLRGSPSTLKLRRVKDKEMNATAEMGLQGPDEMIMWGSLILMIVGLFWSWVLGEAINRWKTRRERDSVTRGP